MTPGRICTEPNRVWVKLARKITADYTGEQAKRWVAEMASKPYEDLPSESRVVRHEYRFLDGIDRHLMTGLELQKVPFLDDVRLRLMEYGCRLWVLISGDGRIFMGAQPSWSDPLPTYLIADLVRNPDRHVVRAI
jgi:hypothetical protein